MSQGGIDDECNGGAHQAKFRGKNNVAAVEVIGNHPAVQPKND